MLEEEGYPFKSKYHSKIVGVFQNRGIEQSETVKNYLELQIPKSGIRRTSEHLCPKILKYQFYEKMPFKISDKCCDKMKKEPLAKWQKDNKRPIAIVGIMKAEGGQRESAVCLVVKENKVKSFQPLAPVTKDWEEWFIEKYGVEICEIYKPPYNFNRTGCKGCPFNLHLQEALDTLERFFPEERKQCEIIWKPVYDEYRRLGYRLKKKEKYRQMRLDEFFDLEAKEEQ